MNNLKKSKSNKNTDKYRQGTKLIILMVFMGCLFVSLAVHITMIEIFHKDDYINNSANQRQWVTEQNILRGEFTDRNDVVLAYSVVEDEEQVRKYNYGSLYTHVIGYSSQTYGKTQLEFAYNKYLLGMSGVSQITDIADSFINDKQGDTVKLTIDNDLQLAAQKALNGRSGAVVAIEPSSGEILCLYSNPTFDPHSKYLERNGQSLTESDNSPFVSRATNGLYAPGSIFKTVMLCAAIENGYEDFTVDDKGTLTIGDTVFENQGRKAYGEIDLKKAYNVSSNVAFMELGIQMGPETIRKYAKKFGIGNNSAEIEIPYSVCRFNYDSRLPDGEIALMSIGQGETLVTPLQMAVMTATIANDGVRVDPHLISKITNVLGITVNRGINISSERIISSDTASIVKDYMVETVESGTGTTAKIKGYTVGGKTGTAENEIKGKEHTWFIGFAPAENPTIAIAVVCEYSGGSGSGNSAPVAREVMRTWLQK